jgi:hypothetical protein
MLLRRTNWRDSSDVGRERVQAFHRDDCGGGESDPLTPLCKLDSADRIGHHDEREFSAFLRRLSQQAGTWR